MNARNSILKSRSGDGIPLFNRSASLTYTVYGFLFGLLFPLCATLIDAEIQGKSLGLQTLIELQGSQPLHWIIDTAPLFLGLLAFFAGYRQDQVRRLNRLQENTIIEKTDELLQSNRELSESVKAGEDARQLLARSEEKYRTLVEESHQGVAVFQGSPMRLVFMNNALAKMLGCEVRELVGLEWDELRRMITHNDRESYQNADWLLQVDANTTRHYEMPARCKDGSLRWLDVCACQINYDDQRALQVSCIDISGRKEGEEKIAKLSDIFGKMAADSVENIDTIVRHTCEVLGGVCSLYNRLDDQSESLITWSDFRAPEDLQRKDEPHGHICYEAVIRGQNEPVAIGELTGTRFEQSDPNVKKYGLRSYLGHPVFRHGEAIGSLCIVDTVPRNFPIVDRQIIATLAKVLSLEEERRLAVDQAHRLQLDLERARKMEAVGTMASGVARDLNNILGPLIGYPELLLDRLQDENPLRDKLKIMSRAMRKASALTHDLLALSRRGQNVLAPIEINDVIRQLFESPALQALAAANPDVTMRLSLAETPMTILGSTTDLAKALMILISNSLDAMKEGGQLSVTSSTAHLERLEGGFARVVPGDYAIIRVQDTGVGIEAADIEHIFEPYYMAGKSGTASSGLGLAVVSGTVKDHRGYYDVFSQVGNGTTFVLYFPLTKVSAGTREEQTGVGLSGIVA